MGRAVVSEADTLRTAQMVVEGKSQQEIADEFGLDRSTVCRRLQNEKVKKLIEEQSLRLAEECYQETIDNIKQAISDFKTTESPDRIRVGWDATKSVGQAMGVLVSNQQQSVFVQNIYNDHRNQIISPVIATLLQNQAQQFKQIMNEKIEPDVIEGEVV